MTREIEFQTDPKFEVKEVPTLEMDMTMFTFLRGLYKPNKIYRLASDHWSELFEAKKALNIIEKIQNAGDLRTIEERIKYQKELLWLKNLRRRGTRLKDAWRLLESEHKAPKAFDRLISSLGDYKDQVTLLGSEERDLSDLEEKIIKFEEKKEPTFVSANFISFFEIYNGYIEEIKAILSKEIPTLTEYDILRKRVRSIRNFYKLAGEVRDNQDAKSIAKYLKPVTVEMGNMHKQIYKLKHQGTIDIDTDTIHITQTHQNLLWEFLNLHTSY